MTTADRTRLERLTTAQLRKQARNRGLLGAESKTRLELLEALLDPHATASPRQQRRIGLIERARSALEDTVEKIEERGKLVVDRLLGFETAPRPATRAARSFPAPKRLPATEPFPPND